MPENTAKSRKGTWLRLVACIFYSSGADHVDLRIAHLLYSHIQGLSKLSSLYRLRTIMPMSVHQPHQERHFVADCSQLRSMSSGWSEIEGS